MTTRKRAVIYGRTSLDKSDGRSVDDQLAELRAWAERADRDVIEQLRDDGRSASRFARKQRPDWQRALELIATRQVDELAVWEVSRSTRDRAVWAALIASCIEASVNIVVNGKVHDPTDPDDAFMLDLGAMLAVRESGVTSKRTLRGVESRAPQGRPHGSLNYGYRIEYDPDTGKPLRRVEDPEKAAVVREIAKRLLAGEPASKIARDLNERGIPNPTGRNWVGGNMTGMIKAPALAGLRVHRGRVLHDVTATWPALLTVEQHHRLVSLLTDPARTSRRTGEHVRHLLVGVAHCAECGGRIRAVTRQRADGRVVNYGCSEQFCVTRLAATVDEFIERLVVGRLSQPDLASKLAALSRDPAVQAAAEEAARLRAKLQEARALVDADRLSLESLADLEARTLPKLRAAEDRSRPRHIPDVVLATAGPDAGARWAATPVPARREIVRALIDVRIARAPRRNQHAAPDYDAIRVTWRTS